MKNRKTLDCTRIQGGKKMQIKHLFLVAILVFASTAMAADAKVMFHHEGNYGYFYGTGAELYKFFGNYANTNNNAHHFMVNEKKNGDRIKEITKFFHDKRNRLFLGNGGRDEVIRAYYPTGKISYPNRA
jgi:hypothetical protein